jgi:hypothetical protein
MPAVDLDSLPGTEAGKPAAGAAVGVLAATAKRKPGRPKREPVVAVAPVAAVVEAAVVRTQGPSEPQPAAVKLDDMPFRLDPRRRG